MNWTVSVIKCLELDYHILFDFMAIADVMYMRFHIFTFGLKENECLCSLAAYYQQDSFKQQLINIVSTRKNKLRM